MSYCFCVGVGNHGSNNSLKINGLKSSKEAKEEQPVDRRNKVRHFY